MKIKIILKSNFEILKIECDTNTNKFLVNNIQKNINAYEFADKICGIVLGWKNEYNGPQILDGESFIIEIQEDNKTNSYTGFNAFPQNYNKFLKLIMEVVEC